MTTVDTGHVRHLTESQAQHGVLYATPHMWEAVLGYSVRYATVEVVLAASFGANDTSAAMENPGRHVVDP